MPLIDAGFIDKDGKADAPRLEIFGPTVEVTVIHSFSEDTGDPKSKTVSALVDTGASETCIDEALANELGLPIVDVREIGSAHGSNTHNVYMAYVNIPQLDIIQYGKFTGVNLKDGGQQHECLLGRTFLRDTIMIYDGYRAQVTIASTKKT